MEYLPQSNDPGCTAGFAHGMVTAIAPDIDPTRRGRGGADLRQRATRYQNYSCIHGFGHAFMRIYGDQLEPALHLCRALGRRAAPDCAQGAYHDYWFAVVGADDATLSEEAVRDPRELCGGAPEAFVRPCWYRAFIENRPAAFAIETPEDLDGLCAGLGGLQREACITAASVIGPSDPVEQLDVCARLPAGRRRRELRPRREGPEPARRADARVRRARRPLRDAAGGAARARATAGSARRSRS